MILADFFTTETKTLCDFFLSVQASVDRVTQYLLLVGGSTYQVELVKVRTSWPGHRGYQKNKREIGACDKRIENMNFSSHRGQG